MFRQIFPVLVSHVLVKTALESFLTFKIYSKGQFGDEGGRAPPCKCLKSRQLQDKGVTRAAARATTQGEGRELPVSNITAGSGSWLGKSSFSYKATWREGIFDAQGVI